jgi:fatty-acyl-CoA synthase
VDAQEVNGILVTATEIEEALCRHPSIRYAAVVRDTEAHIIAAVTAWPGLQVDDRECRQVVTASFGNAIAASLLILPVDRVPLTEQGKPDRTAIRQMVCSLAA